MYLMKPLNQTELVQLGIFPGLGDGLQRRQNGDGCRGIKFLRPPGTHESLRDWGRLRPTYFSGSYTTTSKDSRKEW